MVHLARLSAPLHLFANGNGHDPVFSFLPFSREAGEHSRNKAWAVSALLQYGNVSVDELGDVHLPPPCRGGCCRCCSALASLGLIVGVHLSTCKRRLLLLVQAAGIRRCLDGRCGAMRVIWLHFRVWIVESYAQDSLHTRTPPYHWTWIGTAVRNGEEIRRCAATRSASGGWNINLQHHLFNSAVPGETRSCKPSVLIACGSENETGQHSQR